MRLSKKSRWDFSAEASALPALIVGKADNSHSCADRSVFCPARPVAKKRIYNARFAGKIYFFDKLTGKSEGFSPCFFILKNPPKNAF